MQRDRAMLCRPIVDRLALWTDVGGGEGELDVPHQQHWRTDSEYAKCFLSYSDKLLCIYCIT